MKKITLLLLLFATIGFSNSAEAQDGNEMLAEIKMFAGNFAPQGWAFCNGQLLSINSNQALYSLLGTFYGGDGNTTFALPDLRGRAPVQQGNGPGLSTRQLGQRFGNENMLNFVDQARPTADPRGMSVVTSNSQIVQPSIAINYIICLQGIFPSRN